MKKYATFTLVLILIFSLCGCTGSKGDFDETSSQVSENSSAIDSQQMASDSSNINIIEQVTSNIDTSSKDSTAANQHQGESGVSDVTTSKDNLFDTPIDPEDKYLLKNNHTQLDKEKYYQYFYLNDVEKELYRRLRVAALSYDRVIEASDIDIDISGKMEIVECFLADNPQYFWVSESYGLSGSGDITLWFSDGEIEDGSGFGNADSLKIDARREKFNQVVFDIVSSIDPDASEYEKELAIHDYLTRTTKYDKKAQLNPFVNRVWDSAYDAYGTLVEKEGVCSGYTDAFQYLCYMVGINSNVVYGNAHIWNTVQIDGEWYQVDVTWDDPIKSDGSSGDGNHKYFNLTSAKMYQTHTLSEESYRKCLRVPDCTATENAYH